MKHFVGSHNIFGIKRLFKEYPTITKEVLNYMFNFDEKVPLKMTKAMLSIARKSGN